LAQKIDPHRKAQEPVTANCITPGFVATQLLQDYVLASPGNEGKVWEEIETAVAEGFRCKVGRLGKPDDIASLVANLAGRSSSWIPGSDFRIDGGAADWVN
jgi:NAD(P)-dependent dehydrogenase (short-subunit alcohol dehydrogenase family)